jgi:flagellar biosynthesis protein FlhG
VLEVERGATDEEIRRAFKRMKDIYAPDALCCYGLFDAAAMSTLRARLEEAYDVLLDPARRRPYELSVFPPDPEPNRVPTDLRPDEDRPPPPVITPDTEYTGALLRAVRESQGIDVRDISQRTKIGRPYVMAIEADDFGSLPAPVYVRGFVTEVAKFLRLDAAQVSRTYVRRYQRWIEEREKSP